MSETGNQLLELTESFMKTTENFVQLGVPAVSLNKSTVWLISK